MSTLKAFLRAGKQLLLVVIFVSSCAMTGCVEANWTLANESRLPKGIELPPGLTRKDVSLEMKTYAPLRGPDLKFILKNKKGKKLAEVKGTTGKGEIVVVNGIPDVVALVSCSFDQCWKQDGHVVALFYVLDGSCARDGALRGGLPMCPRNETNPRGLSRNAEGCPCLIEPKD